MPVICVINDDNQYFDEKIIIVLFGGTNGTH